MRVCIFQSSNFQICIHEYSKKIFKNITKAIHEFTKNYFYILVHEKQFTNTQISVPWFANLYLRILLKKFTDIAKAIQQFTDTNIYTQIHEYVFTDSWIHVYVFTDSRIQ